VWELLKFVFAALREAWNAPLAEATHFLEGFAQMALTLLCVWIGLKLLWKGLKGLL
jgi:hypothetical protein